jgi:hypothetical protein
MANARAGEIKNEIERESRHVARIHEVNIKTFAEIHILSNS